MEVRLCSGLWTNLVDVMQQGRRKQKKPVGQFSIRDDYGVSGGAQDAIFKKNFLMLTKTGTTMAVPAVVAPTALCSTLP